FAVTANVCSLTLFELDPTASIASSVHDNLALGACTAPAATVAAVAAAGSAESVAARVVARIAALNDVADVGVLALVRAFFRPTDDLSAWKLPHVAWLFVALGIGGVLGILAYILLRGARGVAEEMAYLLGAVALSAGMAGYLAISPLIVCCVAGALLTN